MERSLECLETMSRRLNTNGEPRRVFYNPEINAGHILTAISMIGSLVIVCSVFYARAAVMEQRIAAIEKDRDNLVAIVQEVSKNQQELTGIIREMKHKP